VSFKKNFFKNLITFGGYNYATQLFNFIVTMVLARLLLPKDYGFVAIITVFTEYIKMFTDAGLSYAIIRSDYKYTYFKAVHSISILIGIILFILMIFLAFPIAYFYNNNELIIPTIVFSTFFIFQSMGVVPYAIHTKELRFNYVGKVRMIGALVSSVLMIIMAAFWHYKLHDQHQPFWALIIPQIIMVYINYVLTNRHLKIRPTFSLALIRVGIRKTKSLIGNLSVFNSINYWSRNADNLIVGKIYGESDLGIYNRGYRLLTMALSLITGLFGTVLYPSLKKYRSTGGDVNKEYISILGVISLINLPVGLPLILFPKQFVMIIWGQNWMPVADLLPYFGLLILSQTLISTAGHIFVLYEREKTLTLLGIIQSVVLIAAIVAGALISLKMLIVFYSISYLLVVVPTTLYLGFYKSFHVSVKQILVFWLPKLIAYCGILYSVYFNHSLLTILFIVALCIHILYFQREEIYKFAVLLRDKYLKKKNSNVI
jgi:O-antigen/teichoic acid export membrane protein